MTVPNEPSIIAGLASVAILSTAAYARANSYLQHLTRETELKAASQAMRKHAEALERLDHDEAPPLLIGMALFVSFTFSDRDTLEHLAEAKDAERTGLKEAPPTKNGEDAIAWSSFAPEDVEAFMVAASTAVMAAELRWPDLRGRIDHPFKWSLKQSTSKAPEFVRFFEGLRSGALMPGHKPGLA